MKALNAIIRRNFLVYLKDKENVFYTLLSMLIIIALMLIFLGDMNVGIVKDALRHMDEIMQGSTIPTEYLVTGSRNPSLDDANARTLVLSLIIAGITIVNGISASMGMLSMMSWDEESGKLASYYVAPISRAVLVSGYVISAIILSVFFSLITVLVSEIILVITGGTLMSITLALKVLGLIVLNSFSTTAFLFFLTSLARTRSAYSGISTFVYTLSGFVTGMYVPLGVLPAIVRKVLAFVPMTQGSVWMRKVFTMDAVNAAFAGLPKEAINEYYEITGIEIKFGDTVFTPWMQFTIMFGSGVLFMILSVVMMNKKNVRDR
ncbi:MAG: ABC transporter permease [Clostridiales bacterium]|jgi:multidrug/hemolysin transport system permease protein|nr:ABC transporter permease [Clostridiales bacterium]